ncbi:MAG: hypothetical protein HZA90_07360 [Verrucomicrobia bacterium]|nr:hypothetical protein [Verrucomicrobiota bacterium]
MSEETQRETPPQNQAADKAYLECEKLKAEIQAIGKPLLRTPGFYSAIAPVALAILGLVFTWSTGWFDVQRTRVSNEKTLLEAQTERLKMERVTLEGQAKEQQMKVERADEELGKLKQRVSLLTNQMARLERDRAELAAAKELLESQTAQATGSEAKASQFLAELKSLQTKREQMAGDLQMLSTSNATLQVLCTRQMALIRWANRVLWEGWRIALEDKSTWAKFRDFGDHVMDVQMASTPYLLEWQIEQDPAPSPTGGDDKTHDEEKRKELEKMFRQASGKNYDDQLRKAKEDFQQKSGEKLDRAELNRTTR